MSNDSIKVLSVNCQGLRGKEKRNHVLHYLENNLPTRYSLVRHRFETD